MAKTQPLPTEYRCPDQYPGLGQMDFAKDDEKGWQDFIMHQKAFIPLKELEEKLDMSSNTISDNIKPYVKHIRVPQTGLRGEFSVFFDREDLEALFAKSENISRRSMHIDMYAYSDIIGDKTIEAVQKFLQLSGVQRRKNEELRQFLKERFYPFYIAHCKDGNDKLYEQCKPRKCSYGDTAIYDKLLNIEPKNKLRTKKAFYEGLIEVSLPGKQSSASKRWFISSGTTEEKLVLRGSKAEQWVLVGYAAWCEFYRERTGKSFADAGETEAAIPDGLEDGATGAGFAAAIEAESSKKAELEAAFAYEPFKSLTAAVLGRKIQHLFITGEAGTGKTAYLCYLIKRLREQGKNVLLCASTGTAANNLNQQLDDDTAADCVTVHSAFAINGPIIYGQYMVEDINRIENVVGSHVIIIDEISMLRMDVFSKVMGEIRQAEKECINQGCEDDLCNKQIIVAGDFFQLPPVITKKDSQELVEQGWPQDWVAKGGYCFFSPSWDFQKEELKTNFRQKDDKELTEMLQAVREGDQARLKSALAWFNTRVNNDAGRKDCISIVDKKATAEKINKSCLERLQAKEKTFYCQQADGDKLAEERLKEMNVSKELLLKVGAKVIATKNDKDRRFFNGFMGTVTELGEDFAKVNFYGEEIEVRPADFSLTKPIWHYDGTSKMWNVANAKVAVVRQLPLQPAYAITIHKAQGMTFAEARMMPNGWAYGQLYTALSRLQSLRGLHLTKKVLPDYVKVSQEVIDFYDENELDISPEPKSRVYPTWEILGRTLKDYVAGYRKAVARLEEVKKSDKNAKGYAKLIRSARKAKMEWAKKINEAVIVKIEGDEANEPKGLPHSPN